MQIGTIKASLIDCWCKMMSLHVFVLLMHINPLSENTDAELSILCTIDPFTEHIVF